VSFGAELLNELGILSVGRNPEWIEVSDTSGAPDSVSDDVALVDAPTAYILVVLRENAAYRTARVTVGADAATVYRTTIYDPVTGSAPVEVDYAPSSGAGTEEAIVQGIATAINGDATASSIVTAQATDEDDDGTDDTVTVTGDSERDYEISTSIVSGGGTISHTADATRCDVRLWGKMTGQAGPGVDQVPTPWVQVNGGVWSLDGGTSPRLDRRGLVERIHVAGLERVHLEIFNADGQVTAYIGRAQEE